MLRTKVADNVSAAWRSGGFQGTKVQFSEKLNRRTTVQIITKPAILPNCCYALVANFYQKTSIGARFFVLFCGWIKNILLFSCVCYIYYVYLCQQNR